MTRALLILALALPAFAQPTLLHALLGANGGSSCTATASPLTGGIYSQYPSDLAFAGGSWILTGQGTTFAADSFLAPDCTNNANVITEDTSNGVHGISLTVNHSWSSATVTITNYFSRDTGTRNVRPFFQNAAFETASVGIDLGACSINIAASGIGGLANITATPTVVGTFCKVVVQFTSVTTATIYFYPYMMSGTSSSYMGDGSSSIAVWGVDVR